MIFCHLPNSSGEIPLAMQTGQILDISKFIHFHFWQKVLVESHKKDKTEELACRCCPAKGVGDELTCMALLTDLEQLVPHSDVQPAVDPLCPNPRECLFADATPPAPTPSLFEVETVSEEDDDDKFENLPEMTHKGSH